MTRLLLLFTLFSMVAPLRAATINVPIDQPTIQDGINATIDGDTVLVAAGAYFTHIVISNSIVLKSVSGPQTTLIVQDDPGWNIIYIGGTNNTSVIDGFTVRDAIYASAVYIHAFHSPTFRNCIFHGNETPLDGGAIVAKSDEDIIIENCVFYDNVAGRRGGAIFCQECVDFTIRSSVFYENVAAEGGGAVANYLGSFWSIEHNIFYSNAGLDLYPGAIYLQSTPYIDILNNTFVGNSATGWWGSALRIHGGSHSDIRNNIFASNIGAPAVTVNNAADFEYNLSFNNDSADYIGVVVGDGNIYADPEFVDATNNDYNLKPTSPCINAGDPDILLVDPDSSRSDIGALNRLLCCTTAGDSDGNGFITIGDVTHLISYVFSGGPAPACQDEGDADGNNALTIGDVTRVIAHIFSGGPEPTCGTTGS